MKLLKASTVLLLLLSAFSLAAESTLNIKKGLGIQGYDPVAYYDEGATKGSKKITHEYQSVTYRFNSEENKAKFSSKPERYLPEYGGYCAYAMLEGNKVNIDPESFKIAEGKLYLYYDGLFGNTLKKWNDLAVDQSEISLIGDADGHWQELLSQ